MALSVGFRGGIGRSYNEGTCGALSAGIMALGIYLPTQSEKALALSKELFDHFKKRTRYCNMRKHSSKIWFHEMYRMLFMYRM